MTETIIMVCEISKICWPCRNGTSNITTTGNLNVSGDVFFDKNVKVDGKLIVDDIDMTICGAHSRHDDI